MKLRYYAETDSLCIDLPEKPGAETKGIAPGGVLDSDEHGDRVGIDIDHASKVVSLSRIEAEALPLTSVALAGA